MFLKIAASGIGGATLVGTGLGLYLSNNKKKEDKKTPPELTDNLAETPSKTNTKRTWNTIVESKEYKEAKTTGKILKHISYQDNETTDDDVGYFLVEMTGQVTKNTLDIAKSISMHKGDTTFLELKNLNNDSTLPLYCFEENDATTADDLNFNNLKKCKEVNRPQDHKFLVVNDLQNKITTAFPSSTENVDNRDTSSKSFVFLFEKHDGNNITAAAKIINFFYKGFSPETTNKAE